MSGIINFPGGGSPSPYGLSANYGYAGDIYSTGCSTPNGRATANGYTPIGIYGIRMWVAGYGAARTVSLFIGGAATNAFTVGASSKALDTGFQPTWSVLGSAQTLNYGIHHNGTERVYFGHAASGGTVYAGSATWSGALSGQFAYVEAPAAPYSLHAQSGTNQATLTWAAPDDGGSAITDYVIHYSLDSSFGTYNTTTSTTTSRLVTGLSASTWYFRVAARNAVTNAVGSWSLYSTTEAATLATVSGAPTALTRTLAPRAISYSWTPPASDGGAPVLSYTLTVATNNTFTTGVQTFVVTGTEKTVTRLADGTVYYAKVLATNAVGDSSAHATVNDTTPARTFQDDVGTAAVSVSGGIQVELRSSGAATPVITLGYLTIGSSTFTTIATLATGTATGTFNCSGALDSLALAADVSGNLYVVGADGLDPSRVLVQRFARSASTTWALSGALSASLAPAGDTLRQFAAVCTPAALLVLARRQGPITNGSLFYGLCDLDGIAFSVGSLFLASGADPSWLSTAPLSGTPMSGALDLVPLVPNGSRVAVLANGLAVVDVGYGTVTSVAQSANNTDLSALKARLVPVSSSSFMLLRDPSTSLLTTLYSTSLATLSSSTIANTVAYGSAFTTAWDARYNRQSGLVVITYLSAARTLSQRTLVPTTGALSAAVNLSTTYGPTSSTHTLVKVPRGHNDERSVLVSSASLVTTTQSLAVLVDVSGNVAPSAPSLVSHATYTSTAASDFTWTFGDQNPADSQSAYQMVVETLAGAGVYDSGKVTSAVSLKTLAANALTNNASYRWKVRCYDVQDTVGPYSAYSTFRVSDAGSVTITSPAADNPASANDFADITWSYSTTDSGAVQSRVRVTVTRTDTSVVTSDTGYMTTTATTWRVLRLLSDVQQRVSVTVQSSSGLYSTAGTRLLTPSYSAPATPLAQYAVLETGIRIIASNPTEGARPAAQYNEVWRREGSGSYSKVGSFAPNSAYYDFAVGSAISYTYYVRAVAATGGANSTATMVASPTLDGVWLHSTDDPEGTISHFPFTAGNKAQTLKVDAVSTAMVGREYPQVDFGVGEDLSVSLAIMVPSGPDAQATIDTLRDFSRSPSTLVYRDNRGRLVYGVLGAVTITDVPEGTKVTGTITADDYLERIA